LETEIERLSCEISERLRHTHTELERLKKALENFTFIGSGLSRYCFLHKNGKYVIKIEKTDSLKKYLPQKLKKYFAEPLAYAKNFRWILMPKAKAYPSEINYDKIYDIVSELLKVFGKHNLNIKDVCNCNVGKIENQSVIFDYGWSEILNS